jgi:hypothetical protein
VSFTIPKASGEPRTITAPRLTLRRVQRQILDELLSKLPTHTAAHGFVKKRSVVTNAKPHESSQLVVKLDLKDFFPTISYHRVRGLLCRLRLLARGRGHPRRAYDPSSGTQRWLCGVAGRVAARGAHLSGAGKSDLPPPGLPLEWAGEADGGPLHPLRR